MTTQVKRTKAAVYLAFAQAAHHDSTVEEALADLLGAETMEDIQAVLDNLNEVVNEDLEAPVTIDDCLTAMEEED